jgi:hypothetical protein
MAGRRLAALAGCQNSPTKPSALSDSVLWARGMGENRRSKLAEATCLPCVVTVTLNASGAWSAQKYAPAGSGPSERMDQITPIPETPR